MTEKELFDKIKQSAENVEIPESLSPENMLKKFQNLEQEKKKFSFRNPKVFGALSAAAVFIICCISLRGMQMNNMSGSADQSAAITTEEAAPAEAPMMEEAEAEYAPEMAAEEGTADAGAGAEENFVERKNAGELYTLAGSYDAVYERLEEAAEEMNMARSESGAADGAAMAEAATSGIENLNVQKEALMDSADEAAGYSETNVQTLGIDESDVVKTDGEYLYLLRGGSVSIVSADGEMKQIGEVKPDTAGGAASVCAMYVDGDKLILMVQEYTAALEETGRKDMASSKEGEDTTSSAQMKQEDMAYCDMLYIDEDSSVSVYTYDISDKRRPALAGKVTQDGSYVTSRKDGNIVYLFTENYLLDDYEKDPGDAIPEVNARKVSADCIYVGERGERALLISSLSLYCPDAVRDTVMILDAGSEIYMGEDSLYLYRTNYRQTVETTQIAKFSLTGGFLNGEAAASVRGIIRDTFAIHEKDGKLRVLTTDMSGAEWENCLFVLDENLKAVGELTHIAVGESIYAARYLGDMAYFITYRNTDPLFAVDLSDERNPKLAGELEITGFSEYLHFWGEDKLLGLGYETDPKTGAQKGLKLVMFDMSEPANLKVLGSQVIEEAGYSPALYNYKGVLAAPEENLIGFVTDAYNKGVKRKYELYRWNEDGFEQVLAEDLTEDKFGSENYRGVYIGERFYVAHPEIIRGYDRKEYGLKQTLTLK